MSRLGLGRERLGERFGERLGERFGERLGRRLEKRLGQRLDAAEGRLDAVTRRLEAAVEARMEMTRDAVADLRLPAAPPIAPLISQLPVVRRAGVRFGAGRWVAIALGGTVLGVLAAFLFDPDRGRGRRAMLVDRTGAVVRRTGRRTGRLARYATSTVAAMGERLTRQARWYVPPNDATLQEKVESTLFRDPTIPKGRMNINVENGVVILRGVGESVEQIERIVAATRAIAGVRDVHSLLHLPDAPVPDEAVSQT